MSIVDVRSDICRALMCIHHVFNRLSIMKDVREPAGGLFDSVRRLIVLNVDYARLSAAEKLSVLLSAIAIYVALLIVGSAALLFLSIGIGYVLAQMVAPIGAFLYVTMAYVVLFGVLYFMRRRLFVDPITRFVTRLFVKPPKRPQV